MLPRPGAVNADVAREPAPGMRNINNRNLFA
jgi:hypothetical protein